MLWLAAQPCPNPFVQTRGDTRVNRVFWAEIIFGSPPPTAGFVWVTPHLGPKFGVDDDSEVDEAKLPVFAKLWAKVCPRGLFNWSSRLN